jgi:hypothetical protein
MAPIISDEQVDELEARRRRRQAHPTTPVANGSVPSGSQSAKAARDLLGGLITGTSERHEHQTGATAPVSADETGPAGRV